MIKTGYPNCPCPTCQEVLHEGDGPRSPCEQQKVAIAAMQPDAQASGRIAELEAEVAVERAARIRLLNQKLSGEWRDSLDAEEAQAIRNEVLRDAMALCNRSYGGTIGDVHKALAALIKENDDEQ